ncbi:protease PrsW [Streptomyces albus]|uniref:Protease PrsW n=1 Tax=Streptomyces albus TaxID=1888 RepID=A0A8H1LDW5_9ACTN|nr:protease PrsW [Streptomyces albus]
MPPAATDGHAPTGHPSGTPSPTAPGSGVPGGATDAVQGGGTPSGPPHHAHHAALQTHPVPSWWQRHRHTLRATTLIVLLALCGLMILALVREQTGTTGLLVGFGLALFPVPLLLAAFRWLSAPLPAPWRTHLFAFAWGACAATLVAILANGFATDWLASSVVVDSPREADTLGATLIAPVVEETTKAAAILLLFLFRRRHLDSVVSGIAAAGITAAGFAFTENILYLGTAYGEDSALDPDGLSNSATAGTFLIRIVFAPFAHPLFTAMTGIAFGVVAALPRRRRVLRVVLPLVGWFTAVLLHAIWNGSASFANNTFLVVYGLFMLPVFGALTWLAVWSRLHELRVVRDTLPAYAAAGWFSEPEPWSLSSMRARSMARAMARRSHGPAAARTVADYQHDATALALLRARATNGATAPDFAAREHALLQSLWSNRPLAGPPTTSAALALTPPRPTPPPPWPGYGVGR